ncbi:hypothetical protein AESSP_01461 [Aestuariimicrobium sp. T2.26MG-19.2B]|nr:hypothetical protein AESSP_01461 [Aestuariimicrobium sp. T2.26MG-19.2B]
MGMSSHAWHFEIQRLQPSGVLTRRELHTLGATDHAIKQAVVTGALRRLRPGWFATAGADPAVVRAVSSGGVLSCVSALRLHGIWTPLDRTLHIRRSEHHRRRWNSGGLKVCKPSGRPGWPRRALDPWPIAVRCAAHCCTSEEFVAILDNVVHLGLAGWDDLADLLTDEPDHVRALLRRCARAESGIESLTRVRLVALGHRVRSQVFIPGVGRIDLLVGDCLALEVDGRETHATPTGHNSDRRRDRRLVALGYTPMRLTWESVMLDWDEVVHEITAALRLGVHRRGPGRVSRRRQLPRSA